MFLNFNYYIENIINNKTKIQVKDKFVITLKKKNIFHDTKGQT